MSLLSLLIPISYCFYYFAQHKTKPLFSKKKTYFMLGLMFFVVMSLYILMPNLLEDNFYSVFGRTYFRFISRAYPNNHLNNFIFFQEYFMYVSFPIILLGLKFRDNQVLRVLNLFFVPIAILINLVGINYYLYACFNTLDFINNINTLEGQVFIILLSLMSLIYYINLKNSIKEGLPKDYKTYLFALLALLAGFIMTIPNIGPGLIFGYTKIKHTDYEPFHVVLILLSAVVPFIIGVVLQYFNKEIRAIALHWLSMSIFIIFIDYYSIDSFYTLSNWPIHLCHTAVYLILISIWFKTKKLFYFTYFVNVLGALFAIIFPSLDTNTSLFSPHGIHFWYSHIGILLVPIIAVKTEYFPKPKLNDLITQAFIFTIYFIFVSIIDAVFPTIQNHPVFGNTGQGVDYFFLNGTTISDHVGLLRIAREKFHKTITINGVKSNIYVFHNLIIYLSFISFTFGLITIYTYIDKFIFNTKNIAKEFIHRIKNHNKITRIKKKELVMLKDKEATLKINHFSKIYPGANFYSVKDFSLSINKGEIFGFIGHNGAGKSTLIKSLVGVNSFEGEISICDLDLKLNPAQAKFLVGYVPDNHPLYERLTGREYIKYVAQIYMVDKEDYNKRLEYYLDLFNLAKDVDRLISTYSHGMKQKISIIASLIHEPKIWILDEPLTGLDPTSVLMVKKCIVNHAAKGNIVFFSSHIIEIVEGICDRIAIIKKGQLMYTGEVKEILKEYNNLTDLYKKYVLDYNAET